MNQYQIRKIENKKELNEKLSLLAGICGDASLQDPFYLALMPNEKRRRRQISWWMRILVRYSFKRGWINYDSGCNGVAFWVGPEKPHLNNFILALMGMIFYPLWIGFPGFFKMMRITGLWSRIHKTLDAPHVYLMAVGVKADSQGKGIGRALITPVLKEADEKSLICYLETATLKNVLFYQSLGFQVIHSQSLFGIKTWMMKRDPLK